MRCAAVVASALMLHGLPLFAQSRMAPVPDRDWTSEQRAVIAGVDQYDASRNDIRTYLNHPVLAGNLWPFEHYISSASILPARDRELLILRTAWLTRSQYVWAHHVAVARQVGIHADELKRIAQGPAAPGWVPFEAALLRAADELHSSAFNSDATWSALAAKYGPPQLIDAVFTVGEFTMIAGTLNSLGVVVEAQFTDRLPTDVPFHPETARSKERLIGGKPRIAPLEPSEFTPEVRQLLDPSGAGRPVAYVYRTYAHNPGMDRPRRTVSEHIRAGSTLSPRHRELVIMRIGALTRSEYEWGAHAPAGRRTGMTDADVRRVLMGPDSAPGDAIDTALLRAVDELHGRDVISDATWDELTKTFNAKQLLDLLIAAGGYRMFSMAINTFGIQLEPNGERFPTSF